MKREELEKLGLSKEVIDTIMTNNGVDVENAKKEAAAVKKEQEELKARFAAIEAEAEKTKKEYEEFKQSKMTEAEKAAAASAAEKEAQAQAIKTAKEMEAKYTHLIKQTKVKDVLVKGGVAGDDVESFTPGLIAETEEESVAKASKFVDFVNAQKKAAAEKAVEEAAKQFKDPKGNPNPGTKTEPKVIEPIW